eukprot:766019-Hanusia_phi.AAC.4
MEWNASSGCAPGSARGSPGADQPDPEEEDEGEDPCGGVEGDAHGVADDVGDVGVVEGVLDEHPAAVLRHGDVVLVGHAGEAALDGVEDGDPAVEAYPAAALGPGRARGGEDLPAGLAGELVVEVGARGAGGDRGPEGDRGVGGLGGGRVAGEEAGRVAAEGVARGALPGAGEGGVGLAGRDEDDRAPGQAVLASGAAGEGVGRRAVVDVVARGAGPGRGAVPAVGGVPAHEAVEALGGAVREEPGVGGEGVGAPGAAQVRVAGAGGRGVVARVALDEAGPAGGVPRRGAVGHPVGGQVAAEVPLGGALGAVHARGGPAPGLALGGAGPRVLEVPHPGEGEVGVGRRVAGEAEGRGPAALLVLAGAALLAGAVEAVLGEARLGVPHVVGAALVLAPAGVEAAGQRGGHAGGAAGAVEEEDGGGGVARPDARLPGGQGVGHHGEVQVVARVAGGRAVPVEGRGVARVVAVLEARAGHRLGRLDAGAGHGPVGGGVAELPGRVRGLPAGDAVLPAAVGPLHALGQAVVAVVGQAGGDELLQRDVGARGGPLGGALDARGADPGKAGLAVLPHRAGRGGAGQA